LCKCIEQIKPYPLSRLQQSGILQAKSLAEYAKIDWRKSRCSMDINRVCSGNDQVRFDMIFQTICFQILRLSLLFEIFEAFRQKRIELLEKHCVEMEFRKSSFISINKEFGVYIQCWWEKKR